MEKRKSYKPQGRAAQGEGAQPAQVSVAGQGEAHEGSESAAQVPCDPADGLAAAPQRAGKPKRASYKPAASADADDAAGEREMAGSHAGKAKRASYKPVPGAKRAPRLTGLRRALPPAVLLVCAVAFVAMVPMGNISAFGWESISAICPMGALSSLLASKTLVPRVLISLVIALALILLFGRAFCSWICSVPFVERLLGLRSGDREGAKKAGRTAGPKGCAGACASCAKARGKALDSRHWVLGGTLLSAAVFGFPVFCLVCPIGLTFAAIFLVLRLFTGSASWALPVVLIMLVVELLVARRWCHRICPLGALMSLVSKGNRTFVPTIDEKKCLETTRGAHCGRCHAACPEDIDLRNLASSPTAINECVKCGGCVQACPAHAVSVPFLPKREGGRENA